MPELVAKISAVLAPPASLALSVVNLSALAPEEAAAIGDALQSFLAARNFRVLDDRPALVNFILQKEGEPAGALLPQWSGGDAFLFPTAADLAGAKELRSQIAGSPKLVLRYDSGDALEKSVAERIAVNAREAGIFLVPEAEFNTKAAGPGARLIRWRMPSSHPRAAIGSLSASLGLLTGVALAPLPDPATPQKIYDFERAVLGDFRIVPLVWVPRVNGVSARVRNWKAPAPGDTWPLADVWLEGAGSAGSP